MEFRATYDRADRPGRDGTFWYAIDRSILAERGLPVTGPPSADVFRSVPDSELVTLLIASLRWHLDAGEPEESAARTDDAVLNACRAWQRIRTGHWSSKPAAGAQLIAEPTSPGSGAPAGALELDRAVIEQALDARREDPRQKRGTPGSSSGRFSPDCRRSPTAVPPGDRVTGTRQAGQLGGGPISSTEAQAGPPWPARHPACPVGPRVRL